MNDFIEYLNWCQKSHLKSNNAKVLELYSILKQLGFYSNSEYNSMYKQCEESAVYILKHKFPQLGGW